MNRGRINLRAKTFLKSLLWMIVFLSFLKPGYLETISILDTTFNVIRVFFFLYICKKIVISKKISYDKVAVAFYTLIPFVITFINNGDIYTSLIAIAVVISAYCMFENDSFEKLLYKINVLSFLLLILIVIDLLSIILYPNGLYEFKGAHEVVFWTSDVWFLGFKNNHAPFLILACFTSAINAYFRKNKKSYLKMLLTHIISLLVVVKMMAGAGIIAFTMYFVLLIIFMTTGKLFTFNFKLATFIHLFIAVALTALSVSVLFGSMFSIIGKNGTASNRIYIWATVWKYILEHPLFGYGYMKSTDLMWLQNIAAGATTSHNTFLDMLFRGGIVTIIVFFVLLVLISKKLVPLKKGKLKLYNYCSISFFAILLTAQTEGFMMSLPIYIMLSICGNISKQIDIKKILR